MHVGVFVGSVVDFDFCVVLLYCVVNYCEVKIGVVFVFGGEEWFEVVVLGVVVYVDVCI